HSAAGAFGCTGVSLNSGERVVTLSGDGIVATSAPGLAARKAFDGQPRPVHGAVALDRGVGVVRAGGCVATGWRQGGRGQHLVHPDQAHERTPRQMLGRQSGRYDVRGRVGGCIHGRTNLARPITLSSAAHSSVHDAVALAFLAVRTTSALAGSWSKR